MPRHVDLSGTVRVAAPPAEAFHFFTPQGESRWLPGWEPEYLHPSDGTLAEGLVFRTKLHGEPAVWLVARADQAAGALDYVRVTPESRIGMVSIRCTAAPGGTHVHVTYRMTALSDAGEQALATFTGQFAGILTVWEKNIAALAGGA
jgi:hypothetical protein